MKKILKITIFLVFFFTENSFSKTLPVGATSGIKSNVLLLIDTSGSMDLQISSGPGLYNPLDVVETSSGDLIFSQYYPSWPPKGIIKFNYDTKAKDTTFGTDGSTYGSSADPDCGVDTRFINSNNIAIFKKGSNENVYVHNFHYREIIAFDANTGDCVEFFNVSFKPISLIIVGGHLFVAGETGSAADPYIYTRNLNLTSDPGRYCPVGVSSDDLFKVKKNHAVGSTAADPSLKNFYYTSRERITIGGTTRWKHIIRRHELEAVGDNFCPKLSSEEFYFDYTNQWARPVGIQIDPGNDNKMYIVDREKGALRKISFTYGSSAVTTEWINGQSVPSTTEFMMSSETDVRFNKPKGIFVSAATNRIHVADDRKMTGQTFDLTSSTGKWLQEVGGGIGSRMFAASEAIKEVVSDSDMRRQINFGFGRWAGNNNRKGKYVRWKNVGTNSGSRRRPQGWNMSGDSSRNGESEYCDNDACLLVKIDEFGAGNIVGNIGTRLRAQGGTAPWVGLRLAEEYFNHPTDSPIDPTLADCQSTYVIVIGDGVWNNSHHGPALIRAQNLFAAGIKVYTVAYGDGISPGALDRFDELAKAGGTDGVIVASDGNALKIELQNALQQIIAENLSFTAPAITAEIGAGGYLYQSTFKFKASQEWPGDITKTKIDSDGNLESTYTWKASENMPAPSSRKIWSIIPGTDYESDYNNFVESNSFAIQTELFDKGGTTIKDFHRKNSTGLGRDRCSKSPYSNPSIQDGTSDDLLGLISFIRGNDYFDYSGKCELNKPRDNYLGDIYHSGLIVVGSPSAQTAFIDPNQESYWRSYKKYNQFVSANSSRQKMIYAGANDGMLHAFDDVTGKEEWAFMPLFVAWNLPSIMNIKLNKSTGGGTSPIYGLDGSPVAHDMYFKSSLDIDPAWHTILMIPYGRGGAGFTVLDVTEPLKPLHLYSIYNDISNSTVYHLDHTGTLNSHPYITGVYHLKDFPDAKNARLNYLDDALPDTAKNTCDSTGNTYCFKSNKWKFSIDGLSTSDLEATKDGAAFTDFTVITDPSTGETMIQFNSEEMIYNHGDADVESSDILFQVKSTSLLSGTTNKIWDYSNLGEVWSSPRILRIPNKTSGDTVSNEHLEDDIYVAVMGGGYGGSKNNIGSNAYVINLSDEFFPGKIQKIIDIEDTPGNGITNSVPSTPLLVTPDLTPGLPWKGGMAYVNDLEGKITKINLTNMTDESGGKYASADPIELFDSTTLFTSNQSVEESVKKPEINKIKLIIFLGILIWTAIGFSTFVASVYRGIRFRSIGNTPNVSA